MPDPRPGCRSCKDGAIRGRSPASTARLSPPLSLSPGSRFSRGLLPADRDRLRGVSYHVDRLADPDVLADHLVRAVPLRRSSSFSAWCARARRCGSSSSTISSSDTSISSASATATRHDLALISCSASGIDSSRISSRVLPCICKCVGVHPMAGDLAFDPLPALGATGVDDSSGSSTWRPAAASTAATRKSCSVREATASRRFCRYRRQFIHRVELRCLRAKSSLSSGSFFFRTSLTATTKTAS